MILRGRVVLVAGGAGSVGGYVVVELLRRGARVVVPSRDTGRLEALAERRTSPLLTTVRTDITTADGQDAVRAAIGGELHGVVASLGAWREGPPLTGVDDTTWEAVMHDNLQAHFVVARAFVPLLAATSAAVGTRTTYAAMGGIAAVLPVPGVGPVCVTGAAQRMLVRVLAAEQRQQAERQHAGLEHGHGCAVHEVALISPVVADHAEAAVRYPGEPVLWGADVGTAVADLFTPAPPGTTADEDVVLAHAGTVP